MTLRPSGRGPAAGAWRRPGRPNLVDLDQVEAEHLELRQYAVQRRLVQEAGEYGMPDLLLRHQRRERGQGDGAEVTVDPDPVQRWSRAHAAMVGARQVSLHHQDLVSVR